VMVSCAIFMCSMYLILRRSLGYGRCGSHIRHCLSPRSCSRTWGSLQAWMETTAYHCHC
jgi:hypothetical protein